VELSDPAVYDIGQHQSVAAQTRDFPVNPDRRVASRIRVKPQRLAHTAL